MTATLKSLEEKLAKAEEDKKKDKDDKKKKDDDDKDKKKDKDDDKEKKKDKEEDDDAEDKDGWRQVRGYFKGKKGVPKAKKFIKFLNMLSSMEE